MANKNISILNRASEFFHKTEKKKLLLIGISAALVISVGVIGAVLLNRGRLCSIVFRAKCARGWGYKNTAR